MKARSLSWLHRAAPLIIIMSALCGVVWNGAPAQAQLQGVVLHLDASDVNADGKPDSGEPAEGASVEIWADTSGAKADLAQRTKDKQPVYRARGLNGKPALEFDGASQTMERLGANLAVREIIAVVTMSRDAPLLTGLLSNGKDQLCIRRYNDDPKYRGNKDADSADFLTGGGQMLINGALSDAFKPGACHLIDAIAAENKTFADFRLSTTAGQGRRCWKGMIAEVVMINHVLSAEERNVVTRYLMAKYGMTAPDTIAPVSVQASAPVAAKPTPAVSAPAVSAPAVSSPVVSALPAATPRVSAPSVSAPSKSAPPATAPSVSAPSAVASELPAGLKGSLSLYLDASDINGDGSAATGEPADGAPLPKWTDKSSAGASLKQDSAADQPLYRSKKINGKPALAFNGTSAYMERAPANLQAQEIFAVVTAAAGGPNLAGLLSNGQDGLNIRLNSGSSYRGNQGAQNNDFMAGGELRLNGSKSDAIANDVPHIIHAIASQAKTFASFNLSTPNHNRNWKGDVAEILMFKRVLSEPERETVFNYLKQKYAISGVMVASAPAPSGKPAAATAQAPAGKPVAVTAPTAPLINHTAMPASPKGYSAFDNPPPPEEGH
ncbi:MAG: hypothetical protein NTX50_07940 [Candidatus Sumerlaeota bacterium]|nr:hypothetical protein [Candidatus Sumerlaeota bacterium]